MAPREVLVCSPQREEMTLGAARSKNAETEQIANTVDPFNYTKEKSHFLPFSL